MAPSPRCTRARNMGVAGTGGRRAHWEASRTALRLRGLGLIECWRFHGNRAANGIDALLRLLCHAIGHGIYVDVREARYRRSRTVSRAGPTTRLRVRLRLR